MPILCKNSHNKVQRQISNLESAYEKISVQIECMETDKAIRSFSEQTYLVRKKHLESALNAIQECMFFLRDMNRKIGVVVSND